VGGSCLCVKLCEFISVVGIIFSLMLLEIVRTLDVGCRNFSEERAKKSWAVVVFV
jgi:hypothetical protein